MNRIRQKEKRPEAGITWRPLTAARRKPAVRMVRLVGRCRWLAMAVCLLAFLPGGAPVEAEEMEANGYVGSVACQPCHEQQFRAFQNFARKSRSFASVEKMAVDLPAEKIRPCYGCHTTGYGKPGGFVSPEQTPELKNVGCEVCHGPGRLHVKTRDPAMIIRTVTIEACKECHTEERVQAFRYKPILYAGSH